MRYYQKFSGPTVLPINASIYCVEITSYYSAEREGRSPYAMVSFKSMEDLLKIKSMVSEHFNRDCCDIPKRYILRLRASGAIAVKMIKILGINDPVILEWKPKKISYTSCIPDEEIILDARRYQYRVDWIRGSSGYYQTVLTKRPYLMEKCVSHMGAPNGPNRGYQVYLYEFPDNHVYVGITSHPKRRHCTHTKIGVVFDHQNTIGVKPKLTILVDLLPWKDAILMEQKTLIRLKKLRLLLNKKRGGSLGNIKIKYPYSTILQTARQCYGRRNFQDKFNAHYQACLRNGWLDNVASELGWPKRVSIKRCVLV